jgi:hypothetical protein
MVVCITEKADQMQNEERKQSKAQRRDFFESWKLSSDSKNILLDGTSANWFSLVRTGSTVFM